MKAHFQMLLAVQVHLLETIRSKPELRPAYHTAMQYWTVPPELKLAYRPTKSSTFKQLLKISQKTASPEVLRLLQEIASLGDNFTPFDA